LDPWFRATREPRPLTFSAVFGGAAAAGEGTPSFGLGRTTDRSGTLDRQKPESLSWMIGLGDTRSVAIRARDYTRTIR